MTRALLPVLLACFATTGCAVVTVGSAAVGVVATGASLAVDATVGAAKMTGRAVGAVVGSGDTSK